MNLVDLFPPSSMLLHLQARDRQSAVREILAAMAERGDLDEDGVKKAERAIQKRESQASTGIGKWLGIPHAKACPFVDGMIGVYARSEEGIPYESVDGELVHVLFLVLSSVEGADEHLSIMKRIASLHRDEKSLRFLKTSTETEKILEIFREADEQFS